jgi:hypothetical protein
MENPQVIKLNGYIRDADAAVKASRTEQSDRCGLDRNERWRLTVGDRGRSSREIH